MRRRSVVLFLIVVCMLVMSVVPVPAGEKPSSGSGAQGAGGAAYTPGSPVVGAVKSVDKAEAVPGDTLNYTVVISDIGVDAAGVEFSDTLDANLTFVPGSLKATPIAVNDSYSCTGNLSISVPATAGVLANDYTGFNPAATITAFDPLSVNGGAVSVAADGSFTYEPAAGYNGTDTFTYTLSNVTGASTATVSVSVTNRIWFINGAAGACTSSCDGRLSHPFTSLSAFTTAGGGNIGDSIFIYSGTYSGNISPAMYQRLIGQGDALNATTLGFTPASYGPALPGAGTKPTLTGTLTVGGNNITVLAIDWHTTTGTAIGVVGATGITFADQCTATADNGDALYMINSDGNFTFRSLSANGGQSGIIWNNAVQATGSLTVTGDGATAASGGTVQNITGADGNGSGYGCGVYLNKASNVSLSFMNLNNFQNYAVRGLSVNNFTMDRCNITGVNGNNPAYYEGAVSFGANTGEPGGPLNGLTGSATISNCTISGGLLENVRVVNQSGSLNRLTLSSDTISGAGGNGVLIQGESNALMNVTVQNSAITTAGLDRFRFLLNGNNTADLVFQGNTLSGSCGVGSLSLVSGNNVGGGAFTTFNISNNTFLNAVGPAVYITKRLDPGTLSGTFSSNTIGNSAVANSGSLADSGLWVKNEGLGTLTARILQNYIYQYNMNGIELTAGGTVASGGNFNITAQSNNVTYAGTGGGVINGIELDAGMTAGDSFAVCALLQSNFLDNAGQTSSRNGGYGIRLAQRMATTVTLPGYTGANNDNTAVQNWEWGRNMGLFAALASNTVGSGGGGFIGGAACVLPSTFTEALPGGDDTADSRSAEIIESDVIGLLPAAFSRLAPAGISSLDEESVVVGDLPAGILAEVREGKIFFDRNASGRGWFVDPSPYDDEEYELLPSGGGLRAVYGSPAEEGVDLLSVLASCLASLADPADVQGYSGPCVPESGIRCFQAANANNGGDRTEEKAADEQDRTEPARASSLNVVEAGETITMSLGTLPAGKSVTLQFAATIADPLIIPAAQVTNQCSVSGSNFSSVNSNTVTTALPAPAINLVKTTNGTDNNTAPGPMAAVGSTVTWTYSVTNSGNIPLTNVIVTDDRGVVPVYQSGDANGNGLLDLTETWVYTATGIAVAGQYTNLGTASGLDSTNSVPTPVTSTDPDHYFGANPAIHLVKTTNGTDNNTVTGPTVTVGSTVTWTYTVTNSGNVPLKTVTVTDDQGALPVYQSGDINGNGLLDLTETWIYTATGVAVAGQYTNIGTANGMDSTDTVVTPVTSTDPDHYFGVNPAIHLVKLTNGTDNNAAPGPMAAVGSTVTWTYTVTNTGNVPLTNVIVTDDRGVVPVYQNGDANSNGLLDLTETWVYTATGIAVAGQYTNLGTASGRDSTGAVLTPVTSTDPDHYFGVNPAIHLVKLTNGTDNNAAPGPSVIEGSTVTWTYTVTNSGNVPLKTVTVTDDQGALPVYQSGDINGNGLLDLTETWIYTATGVAVAGQYTNIGTANGMDSTDTVVTPVTSTDPDHYFGVPQADLSITKTDGTTTAVPGGSTTYTVTVLNIGPSFVTGATVADNLPASIISATWTAVYSGVGAAGPASGSGSISAAVNLPVGGTATFTVSCVISPSAVGEVTNTAVATTPGGTTDPNMGNNIATDTDTLTPQADISVTMTDSPDPVILGQNITYTITVTNNGPSDAQNVSVDDGFPLIFVSQTQESGPAFTLTNTATSITDTVSSFPAGASAVFTLVLNVPAGSGIIGCNNVVNVTSSTPDPALDNNSASASTLVISQADLSMTMTDNPDPVTVGQNITYTITVTNNGPGIESGVQVVDALPAGLSFVSASGTGWSCANAGGTVTCTATGTLASGATAAPITIVATVNTTASIVNTAVVSGTLADPNSGNNTSTATTTVNCQAITVTAPVVSQGIQNVPFSQTFTQAGGIAPVNFSTASTLPAGMTLAANGVLSGTPTNYGTFPITVTATDTNGCSGSQPYTLVILQAPSQPVITTITDDSPCIQSGISITFTAGSPATRHDLYREGVLIMSGVSSPIYYNPGDTSSHSYVVRAVNTDEACFSDSSVVSAADANGTPSKPVITGITDPSPISFGLVITYTPGTPAERHDLYKDGVLAIAGFASGGTYAGSDSLSHSYRILAVNGSCSTLSDGVSAVDRGTKLSPRPRVPIDPLPFPR